MCFLNNVCGFYLNMPLIDFFFLIILHAFIISSFAGCDARVGNMVRVLQEHALPPSLDTGGVWKDL